MGRKRKDFSDKFKIEVAKEALKKRAKETEVAAKYNIAPSTLSEWRELFRDGKLETEEQKALREENEKLRAVRARRFQPHLSSAEIAKS